MMGIVVPETCWAYKKYNEINKWHLVGFYSSVITMIHGSPNIKNGNESSVSMKCAAFFSS